MYLSLDKIALSNEKLQGTQHFYALRHKETRLYFHKRGFGSDSIFTAKYPMFRQKGVWTKWLKSFESPEDWEIIKIGVIEEEIDP